MANSLKVYLLAFAGDRRGNVSMLFGLLVAPLLLFSGLAVDLGRAERERDNAQSALDSAVLAGARADEDEREDVAKRVYASNVGNTYAAKVTPTFSTDADDNFTGSLTFSMNTMFGNLAHVATFTMTISASAATGEGHEFCVLALGKNATVGIRGNGTNSANLGCNTMSNSDASCNGHDLGAPVGRAAGLNDGCGQDRKSYVKPLADPYSSLSSNIPSDPCSSYSILTSSKKSSLPSSNKWSGSKTLTGTTSICGDLQLTAGTNITAPSDGAVLILWNGRLLLNGYTLKTLAGSGLTIIFAGANSNSYYHYPSGTGALDIAAPTSGTWSGVALYQAPNVTTNVDITYTGNDPTWDITGLVYMPNAAVTFKGAVNKSSNGYSCFALVSDSVLVAGTGLIFTGNTECERAGLIRPTDDEGEIRLLN